jgi:protein-L-isoaspartate(D-aspartate) O-methyltransferase
MIEEQLVERGIRDAAVLRAMAEVPRHRFVDPSFWGRAYGDHALPTVEGQTISQPYIVARMTEALLQGSTPRKVLEVGTGCGYQTAVLAPLVKTVYSIERIAPLFERARARVRELELHNVHLRHADGFLGWPTHAPFDAILLAAAPLALPEALLEQLAQGGRLIAPVGPEGHQELIRVTRRADELHTETLGLVSFVPLLKGLS